MSIQLFSGLPGAGKTLSLLERLVQFRSAESQRPVYAYGIAGLKDGLALPCDPSKPPIRNPNFGEVDEPEFLPWWAQLPHGSVICIDEVQKVWPTDRTTGKDLRLDIAMLNEHRHWGYDFLLTTQTPSYLHKHVRGLVDEHTHVVRRWGGKTVDRYVWQEGQEDVKSRAIRAAGSRQRWKYPKKLYDLYQSSTMHTVERRLPWQWYMMIACVVLAPLVGWFAWRQVYGLRNLGHDANPHAAAASSASPASYAPAGAEKTRWATVEDYVHDHLPRVANQPWSAPVFDQEAIAAKPDLLCIEYHRVIKGTDQELCSCYTEQVTPYELHSLEECRRYARHGVYNPRRSPVGGGDRFAQERQEQNQQRRSDAGTRSAAESPADGGAWQPAWRTRTYVQPERTSAAGGPRALSSYGGGGG